MKYFFSFSWTKAGQSGFGNAGLELKRPITGHGVLRDVADYIKGLKETGLPKGSNIVILNWRRFEEEAE